MKLKALFKYQYFLFLFVILAAGAHAQDTVPPPPDSSIAPHLPHQEILPDTTFRILNLNPYFTLHVDSTLSYDLEINRSTENYFWYLRNSPIGVRIDKNTGLLYFKADKAFFKSGKLKYDAEYKVQLGVQNIQNPQERVDTSFIIVFYSTEINPSHLKPSVGSTLFAEEGDSIRFKIQCENGSFPVEQITINTNMPIYNYKAVHNCDDEFAWMVPFDFIRDDDTAKQKTVNLQFISADKFFNKDTALVKIVVRPGVDYPLRNLEHAQVTNELQKYILSLKLTFYVISKNVKGNKTTRTAFDITGSTTALAGTVISTSAESKATQNVGKILPSVGLTLVPVKEAVAPNKIQEQNTATQVRTIAKRLEYLASENALLGNRDPQVLAKTKKMQEELKQARLQLVDLPMVEIDEKLTAEEAEKYFKDPKVNKKYKLKVN